MYEFEYMQKLTALLQVVHDTNKDKVTELARVFADCIKNDKVIHTFGTGHSHMIGIELFARAGGLGNVDAILVYISNPDTKEVVYISPVIKPNQYVKDQKIYTNKIDFTKGYNMTTVLYSETEGGLEYDNICASVVYFNKK